MSIAEQQYYSGTGLLWLYIAAGWVELDFIHIFGDIGRHIRRLISMHQ